MAETDIKSINKRAIHDAKAREDIEKLSSQYKDIAKQIEGGVGGKGEDGVGILSVAQTTTSVEDGGNNVITVTKTDNTTSTFIVKNGSKGDNGEKGDKGDTGAKGDKGEPGNDYILTANDKTEIAEKVNGVTLVQAPTYVENISDMKDTSKLYVLSSTGEIYAYMNTTTEQEVMKTDTITATSDNGYKDGNRLGSSPTTFNNDATGYHCTPLIDITKTEYQGKEIELHLEGCQYSSTGTYATWIQTRAYGIDKTGLLARVYTSDNTGTDYLMGITNGITVIYDSDTSTTIKITVPPTYGSGKVAIGYLQFCGKGSISDSNIYINYKTTQSVTGGQWVNTKTTYAPTITDETKTEIANMVANMIDTQMLDTIGNGEVSV